MQGVDGEFCILEEHCQAGLECRDQECKEPLRLKGESCTGDSKCADDLFCLRSICSMPGANDEFCVLDEHCLAGLECRDQKCQEPLA